MSIPINKLPVEILHQFPFHEIHHCPPFSRWFWSNWAVLGKFFIMSTEFVKNIWDWSHDCTDHENDIGFFMRLVKWPNIAVKKKAKNFRNYWNKSRPIFILHKTDGSKKCASKLIFSNEFFRKIRMIFDIENSLWKSNFCTLRRAGKARQSIPERS